jgi:hypothetical protein
LVPKGLSKDATSQIEVQNKSGGGWFSGEVWLGCCSLAGRSGAFAALVRQPHDRDLDVFS